MTAALGSLSLPLKLTIAGIGLVSTAAVGLGVFTVVDGGANPGAKTHVLGDKFTASNSTTNAPGALNAPLQLTGQIHGDLRPGMTRTLTVTVHNPNSAPVEVTAVKTAVGTPSNARAHTNLPACDAAWVTATDFSGSASPVIAPANGSTSLSLSVVLQDLPAVNQDNCKSVTFPISLTAVGTQAK